MTKHLHATFVTHIGIAANNRGETEGNITTLQKIMWKNDLYTTVSAEAIRFALRYYWQQQYERTGDEAYLVNRVYDGQTYQWKDESFADEGELYIDDDVLGYMDAKAPKSDSSEDSKGKKKGLLKCAGGHWKYRALFPCCPFWEKPALIQKGA